MANEAENATILTHKVIIEPDHMEEFAHWQAKFNAAIASQAGFVSLEIVSPSNPGHPEWLLVQRFSTPKGVLDWYQAGVRKNLMNELEKYTKDKRNIEESFSSTADTKSGVTEVFITQVSPQNEKAYRNWIAKIHRAEAKFPGFRGVYMQSPADTGGINWITLLQFDTPEHLEAWLNSPQRQEVLEEGKSLISSLDTHRMISSYAGWFSSIAKTGELPPVWKQTMIVLLVLFPIVMLEIKYLTLLTGGLNLSLGTFIGNTISVILISWPLMPIAILLLGWWLVPRPDKRVQYTILGTSIVVVLYMIEIAIFWNLL